MPVLELVPLEKVEAAVAAWYAKMNPPKVERGLVVALRQKNPCLTLQEVGDTVGVSRERVRQILAAEGRPTRRSYAHTCQSCGKRTEQENKLGLCQACKTLLWTFADIPCFCGCGKIVRKRVAVIANNARHGGQGRVFYNRTCFGRWAGRNRGWGRNQLPETAKLRVLALGETLRVRCRWKHTPRRGCGGRSWASEILQQRGLGTNLHCAKGWCSITAKPLTRRASSGTLDAVESSPTAQGATA